MKKTITVDCADQIIIQDTDIVYAYRKFWCDSVSMPLKLSLLLPRRYFPYDPQDCVPPLLVWICGGGFTEMNQNVWLPEMTYFAKRGYAVASVAYTVTTRSRWPQQIIDVKEAIRFLRAHADVYHYDAARIAVMGESAGGYLSALTGTSGETKEYDSGNYLDQSSEVQAAVPFYPPVDIPSMEFDPEKVIVPEDMLKYVDPRKYISPKTPPFMILHGTDDSMVAYQNGEKLYDALREKGVEAELYLINGADHAQAQFYQDSVKEMIVEFLDKHIKNARG